MGNELKSDTLVDNKNEQKILVITKSVVLCPEISQFTEDFYKWKINYWKNCISKIRNVVAPMVDQR